MHIIPDAIFDSLAVLIGTSGKEKQFFRAFFQKNFVSSKKVRNIVL
jgi:hypothetical protein